MFSLKILYQWLYNNNIPCLTNNKDGRVEGCVLISYKNSKITTCCWTTINMRMLDSTKNDTPSPGQRRSPSKMVGGAKSHLESTPYPPETLRGLKQYLVWTKTQRPHRDWARPAFQCLSVSWSGKGQKWPDAGAVDLGTAGLCHAVCGISPLGGGCH